jgi:hydroxymethylpyrimidine/phosphomethylpyrimidine kinase
LIIIGLLYILRPRFGALAPSSHPRSPISTLRVEYILLMPASPIILSIAGYDPSSGAGITADIKTAAAYGCYAVTCITALTVQTTQGVFAVEPVPAQLIRNTLAGLQQDFNVAAIRLGMLGAGAAADEVAAFLEQTRIPNLVLDPVLQSSSGASLLDPSGLQTLRERLLPLADLITPNSDEAATLAGVEPLAPGTRWDAAAYRIGGIAVQLHALGARGVLITGGHLLDPVDYLSIQQADGNRLVREFPGKRLESRSTHGTGCALATAIACLLAQGKEIPAAVSEAKEYVWEAIRQAEPLGKGVGPINHLPRK